MWPREERQWQPLMGPSRQHEYSSGEGTGEAMPRGKRQVSKAQGSGCCQGGRAGRKQSRGRAQGRGGTQAGDRATGADMRIHASHVCAYMPDGTSAPSHSIAIVA